MKPSQTSEKLDFNPISLRITRFRGNETICRMNNTLFFDDRTIYAHMFEVAPEMLESLAEFIRISKANSLHKTSHGWSRIIDNAENIISKLEGQNK